MEKRREFQCLRMEFAACDRCSYLTSAPLAPPLWQPGGFLPARTQSVIMIRNSMPQQILVTKQPHRRLVLPNPVDSWRLPENDGVDELELDGTCRGPAAASPPPPPNRPPPGLRSKGPRLSTGLTSIASEVTCCSSAAVPVPKAGAPTLLLVSIMRPRRTCPCTCACARSVCSLLWWAVIVIIGRRRVVIWATSPSTVSTARSASARTVALPGLVQTSQYDKEDDQENRHEEVAGVCFAALRPSRRPLIVTGFPIFCHSLFGQQESVFRLHSCP